MLLVLGRKKYMDKVEVVYATAHRQSLLSLELLEPQSIAEVIRRSDILHIFPELNPSNLSVGIWGKPKTLETLVQAGDRIEIYRPLTISPMEARRLRALKKKK